METRIVLHQLEEGVSQTIRANYSGMSARNIALNKPTDGGSYKAMGVLEIWKT